MGLFDLGEVNVRSNQKSFLEKDVGKQTQKDPFILYL